MGFFSYDYKHRALLKKDDIFRISLNSREGKHVVPLKKKNKYYTVLYCVVSCRTSNKKMLSIEQFSSYWSFMKNNPIEF